MVTIQDVIDMCNSLEKGDVLEIRCIRGVVQSIRVAEHGGYVLHTSLISKGKRKSFGFTFFHTMEEGWMNLNIRFKSDGYCVYNLMVDTFKDAKVIRP